MRRTLVTLLAALAVLTVAAGGVAAADVVAESAELSPAEDDGSSEVTPDDDDIDAENTSTTHPTPHTDESKLDDDEAEAGICVVGADSPCNGEDVDGDDGERIGENDSDDGKQILIPEDQNRDGEIDDRFKGDEGDGGEAEVGVCMIGVESPCNGDDADGTDGEEIGDSGSDEEEQILIPEDQNRDGEIDDRFKGDGLVEGLLSAVFGFF